MRRRSFRRRTFPGPISRSTPESCRGPILPVTLPSPPINPAYAVDCMQTFVSRQADDVSVVHHLSPDLSCANSPPMSDASLALLSFWLCAATCMHVLRLERLHAHCNLDADQIREQVHFARLCVQRASSFCKALCEGMGASNSKAACAEHGAHQPDPMPIIQSSVAFSVVAKADVGLLLMPVRYKSTVRSVQAVDKNERDTNTTHLVKQSKQVKGCANSKQERAGAQEMLLKRRRGGFKRCEQGHLFWVTCWELPQLLLAWRRIRRLQVRAAWILIVLPYVVRIPACLPSSPCGSKATLPGTSGSPSAVHSGP
jgi:hypothetical protein